MLDDREQDPLDEAVDPPETGGGTESAVKADSTTDEGRAVDPPENGGGT